MKIKELDGAFCENVLPILDMILLKPRFRASADQLWLVGTMKSAPPEARKKNVIKQLIWHYLNTHHRQREPQTRDHPLRTPTNNFNKLFFNMRSWKN